MIRTAALCIAAVVLLDGCQSFTKPEDLHATWAMSPKRLPAAAMRNDEALLDYMTPDYDAWLRKVSTDVVKPGVKVPAVLYLHGCAGFTSMPTWGGYFVRRGFAFFAPNSFARPGRARMCGRDLGGLKLSMRQEEMQYALQKLRAIDWIDQRRIVLVGYSEGAHPAAHYQGTDFAAVVLLGIDCRMSGGSPLLPPSIPVLNIVGSLDEYGYERGCGIRRTTGGSRRVVLQDTGHAVDRDSRAFEVMDEFLRASVGID